MANSSMAPAIDYAYRHCKKCRRNRKRNSERDYMVVRSHVIAWLWAFACLMVTIAAVL